MMKRNVISLMLALLLIAALPMSVLAAEPARVTAETEYFEDGSYLVTTISESAARASGTKEGKKIQSYYNPGGSLAWQATLTATFTYNGTTAGCTSVSCPVTIYNTAWSLVSRVTSRSGNTATANFTMGYTSSSGSVSEYPYTITLICDKYGNLS